MIISVGKKIKGRVTCLFYAFLCGPLSLIGQINESENAHRLILELKTNQATNLLVDKKTPVDLRLAALARTVDFSLYGTEKTLIALEPFFEESLYKLKDVNTADALFAQAEMRLLWAYIYASSGHSFSAAWNIRQAYSAAATCTKNFPTYLPIRKTTGILNIILGSVPEQYKWITGLFNMEGSVDQGIHDLNAARRGTTPLNLEANLLYCMVEGYVMHQPDSAIAEINVLKKTYPSNSLILFLHALLNMKAGKSEAAFESLQTLKNMEPHSIPQSDYLLGEVYLHKAQYKNAIQSYADFIQTTQSNQNLKDAWYKTGLCYWLGDDEPDARKAFEKARVSGTTETEADRYAASRLQDKVLPNVLLTRARFFTDGGYYDQADKMLRAVNVTTLTEKRDQIEFDYRRARLAHARGNLEDARVFYKKVISGSEGDSWYFAPNACLQMGYIFMNASDTEQARIYFKKVFEYKKYEYKNSIESKAKTALAKISGKP